MNKNIFGGDFPKGKQKDGKNGKSGFYIALILLIAAMGISGYYLNRERNVEEATDTIVGDLQTPQPTQTPLPTVSPGSEKVNQTQEKATGTKAKANVSKTASNEGKKPVATVAKVSKPMFSFPVEGKPIVPYSPDKLIYNETYEDWRTHNGVDILAPRGAQVKAISDGLVEKVYRDERLGITIVINHGDVKSLYACLSTDSMVIVGQQVKRGDIISGIGESPTGESGLDPHLHLQILEDNNDVNPNKYLAYADKSN